MTNNIHRLPYLNGVCESCVNLDGNACLLVNEFADSVVTCSEHKPKVNQKEGQ